MQPLELTRLRTSRGKPDDYLVALGYDGELFTEETDLAAELKRGLAFVRHEKEPSAATKQTVSPKKTERR